MENLELSREIIGLKKEEIQVQLHTDFGPIVKKCNKL